MSQPLFDVIVCGSLHLDIIVDAPHLPRLDETTVGTAWRQMCGGKGGNQAVQAARAGARTAMIGRVGADDFGTKLVANLDRSGVDRSEVREDTAVGSGMSAAILNSAGEYGAVIVSGANLLIDAGGIEASWDRLGRAKVLVLQNEVPHVVNVAAAMTARKSGALVVLNAAPARSVADDLLDLVDVLIVNRIEAELFCGHLVTDAASAREALPSLTTTTRGVVITLGGAGLVAAAAGSSPVAIAPVLVDVVSTHGAGDCFVGALASRFAQGDDLIIACHFANAAAAAYVSGKVIA